MEKQGTRFIEKSGTRSGLANEDSEFMARAKDGDQAAFETLMERWEIPVRRFLGRALQNTTEADELAQQTFIQLWQNRADFNPRSAFRPWVMATAVRLARERLRWWHKKPVFSLEPWTEVAGGENPTEEPLSEGEIVVRERGEAVRKGVAALSPGLRVITVLFEFEAIPQPEIAEIVGASAKAVETRLFRARTALRAALANVD
jgi:RNA polymerase sigma factor (sigma-70 family)